MATTKHGRRTARCAGWAPSTAYQKKEIGETGEAAALALQGGVPTAVRLETPPSSEILETYDDPKKAETLRGRRRVNVQKIRLGSVNVGTMVKRSGEIVEMVGRRNLDFCCLQETKWKGEQARFLEADGKRYKFIGKGCKEGTSGVGILIAENWVEHVVEVRKTSERLMLVKIQFGKRLINIVSAYAPQSGRPDSDKEEFWLSMLQLLSGIKEEESVFVGGDLNGHVGREADGFEGVHGGNGFGKRNKEGEMLLEFAVAMDLVVSNTYFMKSDSKKSTYESGGNRSEIDFILVRRKEKSVIKDVTVINGEPCLPQHKLLVCKVELCSTKPKTSKAWAADRCRVWLLKKEKTEAEFRQEIREKAENRTEGDVDSVWKDFKECLTDAANKTCGRTKGKRKQKVTGWWNNETSEAIKKKRKLFRVAYQTGKEEDKEAYQKSKREAKVAVAKAKEAECSRFADILDKEDSRQNIFKIAKQITRQNKDVTESSCIKDSDGRIVTDECKIRQVWREYFDKLLNEEYPWDRDHLSSEDAVCGPSERITPEEVKAAVAKMKIGKAAGPSGVVSEMLKAAGEDGIKWMTDLFNQIISEGKIPDDWKKSWIVAVYKGKGDALECGSYRGIKLLDHAMKVFERVVEKRVRENVDLDEMQFGFRPGRGTTDAIFVVRQLQEKYLSKNKELWMAFVDLEKAFDRVPREVLWWALRHLKVPEWLIKVIKSMYENVTTAVKVKDGTSDEFEVKVGVHQGSVLSPLLFIMVIEALSQRFRGGLPWELLYADDLVIIAESEEILMERIEKWKEGLESKGLKVNIGKTKVLKCEVAAGPVEETGKYSCGVCSKGVGKNSILCAGCKKWIHKRCTSIKGRIKVDASFQCSRCTMVDQTDNTKRDKRNLALESGVEFECVDKFCYLGDMIGAGGGAGLACGTRVRCAWNKFRELSPILTARGASLRLKGKIYKACVQSVLVYGSETWPMKVDDKQRLERTERMMVRWMCSVTLKNRISSAELNSRLDIKSVSDVVRNGRLRWFGHVERKSNDDWVKKSYKMEVAGKVGRGRRRKTWLERVNMDMKELGLRVEDTSDRNKWRRSVFFGAPSDPCIAWTNRR